MSSSQDAGNTPGRSGATSSYPSAKADAWRKTTQRLMPPAVNAAAEDAAAQGHRYRLYPSHPLPSGTIGAGFDALAEAVLALVAERGRCVRIDGYVGVFWEDLATQLAAALAERGCRAVVRFADEAMQSAQAIGAMIEPYLGGDDPIFGKRCPLDLAAWFDAQARAQLGEACVAAGDGDGDEITLLVGPGAGLIDVDGPLLYVDLPKNELQFRARAGSVYHLGERCATDADGNAKAMYKRFYFVEWPVLNRHLASLLDRVDLFVDGQSPEGLTFASGDAVRDGLAELAASPFRARPWFEPGAWGGQWIKEHIPDLPGDVINYAWSFELISPENGLLFASDGHRLELAFDTLMAAQHHAILGASADVFGPAFPIRFDFLDTFDGGNLSLQCHPRLDYMRAHFGEAITQDETYYMLDAKPGAEAYLGFQADVDPAAYEAALRHAQQTGEPMDVTQFVQAHTIKKHDLLLIPNGTVHCAGEGNMVLEISATPYIFTFKMYDWQRVDLDGKPRPLNIDRAMANLRFEHQGDMVSRELISHPVTLAKREGLHHEQLPTHPLHFYAIERVTFTGSIELPTHNSANVLSLVEGKRVRVATPNGVSRTYHYAETFIVPASAERFTLSYEGDEPCMVVLSYVKDEAAAADSPWRVGD